MCIFTSSHNEDNTYLNSRFFIQQFAVDLQPFVVLSIKVDINIMYIGQEQESEVLKIINVGF